MKLTDDLYYRKLESTSTTDLVDMIREKDKRIAELEQENAELKADNDARKFAMTMSEKVEKQLRNERNTFLAQNEQYEKDLIDFNENLTKAKEIIKDFLLMTKVEHLKERYESVDEAEQFLNEVEK